MPKHYRLYDQQRDFHVTLTDDNATIFDAVEAVRDAHGVEAFGVRIYREEPRASEEVVIV